MTESNARRATEERTDEARGPDHREELTATEARQGQIVVGRFGQIMWIVFFAVLIIGLLVLGVWALA